MAHYTTAGLYCAYCGVRVEEESRRRKTLKPSRRKIEFNISADLFLFVQLISTSIPQTVTLEFDIGTCLTESWFTYPNPGFPTPGHTNIVLRNAMNGGTQRGRTLHFENIR